MLDDLDQSDPTLPPKFVADLKGRYGHSLPVSRAIEERILASANRRLRNQRRFRQMLQWAGAASAAALVALVFWLAPRHSAPELAMQSNPSPEGRVNILGAFQLALALDQHRPLKAEWDINHDGVIDQKDVETFAAQAVSLKGDSRS